MSETEITERHGLWRIAMNEARLIRRVKPMNDDASDIVVVICWFAYTVFGALACCNLIYDIIHQYHPIHGLTLFLREPTTIAILFWSGIWIIVLSTIAVVRMCQKEETDDTD